MSDLKFYCKVYADEIKSSLPMAVLLDFFKLNCALSYCGLLCDSAVSTFSSPSSFFGRKILY